MPPEPAVNNNTVFKNQRRIRATRPKDPGPHPRSVSWKDRSFLLWQNNFLFLFPPLFTQGRVNPFTARTRRKEPFTSQTCAGITPCNKWTRRLGQNPASWRHWPAKEATIRNWIKLIVKNLLAFPNLLRFGCTTHGRCASLTCEKSVFLGEQQFEWKQPCQEIMVSPQPEPSSY